MYTREQLQGILLTIARPEVTIYSSGKNKTGYTVRLRIMFRANRVFLNALERTFEQNNIKCIVRDVEGVNRMRPILIVGKRQSIRNLRNLIPNNVPKSHSDWYVFDTILEGLENGEHLEDEGMRTMLELVRGNG